MINPGNRTLAGVCLWAASWALMGFMETGRAASVDFNRDVRPILSENCFQCHGPDAQTREADLRLDQSDSARETRESGAAVVPGNPEASLVWQRIQDTDPDSVMPPPGSNRILSSSQKAVLEAWIRQGGDYAGHWAFEEPVRPELPVAGQDGEVPEFYNEVDAFVWSGLRDRGLGFSEEATPSVLVRRLHLDLTGLPPSPDQVDEFIEGMTHGTPGFYADYVDRLLKSARFGERWARPWLDLARYADSNGFQADQLRESWAYRDWVIRAMNDNMPFDRFTVEQLAGDLLPDATLDQRVATGFHRTVTCNVEAGVHAEANRVNQVVDRVNTTATVWLGLTLECAQCHDHKYDPLSMDDYYSFFAYFNNTPLEVELPTSETDVQHNFVGPFLDLPWTPEQLENRSSLQKKRDELALSVAETEANSGTGKVTNGELRKELDALDKKLSAISPHRTLVMEELETPRETRVMRRGNYQDPLHIVEASPPQSLHPMTPGLPGNRLGLAQWIMSTDNPLVARVTVNRLWAELWGRGIVRTLEDFGTQSEPPTHPGLLDWLAVEFMESGWDRKSLIRTICLSRAYRQSSRVTRTLLENDPDNRWLSRGARFRLEAERIRDNALAFSGLLSDRMYGEPVMPFQPEGIWRAVGRNAPVWKEMMNEDRWRRGIYIVHRRAAPYPSMVNFDVPDRAACTVSRPRTNTPLQALTLMNDPAFLEMALALADRVLNDYPQADFDVRLRGMFRLVLSRNPSMAEVQYLRQAFNVHRDSVGEDFQSMDRLLSMPGLYYQPVHENRRELALWFLLASTIINLDETITRG